MEKGVELVRVVIEPSALPGVRRITADGWDGQILDMSRDQFTRLSEKRELDLAATYIIFADHFDKGRFGASLYVGQGDDIRQRLAAHVKDKLFWSRVLICSSPRMNVAMTFNIERAFILAAKNANRYEIANGDDGQTKKLSPEDANYVTNFVETCITTLGFAGIDVFSFNQDGKFFYKNAVSEASIELDRESNDWVTVLKGSRFLSSFLDASEVKKLLELQVADTVGRDLVFNQDHRVQLAGEYNRTILGRTISVSMFKSACGVGAHKFMRPK